MIVQIPGAVHDGIIEPQPKPRWWPKPTIKERRNGARSFVYDVPPIVGVQMSEMLLEASVGHPDTKLRVEARLVCGRIQRYARMAIKKG